MGRFDTLLKNIESNLEKVKDSKLPGQGEIQPGDESKYNDSSNLRNYAVEKLGLPKDWKMNLADEKAYFNNLPEQMGSVSGTIGKAGGLAEQALAKLQAAEASGQRLDSGLKYLLNKATGKSEPVVGLGTPPNSASTLRVVDNVPKKMLPNLPSGSKSMDQILMEAKELEPSRFTDLFKK